MKCKDFRSQVIVPAAAFLEAGGGVDAAFALRSVGAIFDAMPDKTVADLAKRLKDMEVPSDRLGGANVGAVVKVLPQLRNFLSAVGKPAMKDVDMLLALLQRHHAVSVNTFVAGAVDTLSRIPVKKSSHKLAVREDLVDRYLRRLEDALGDAPGFARVFAQLSADAEMKTGELKSLSRRFALGAGQNREAALKKIYARHQALMTSRARSAATAGRIAG